MFTWYIAFLKLKAALRFWKRNSQKLEVMINKQTINQTKQTDRLVSRILQKLAWSNFSDVVPHGSGERLCCCSQHGPSATWYHVSEGCTMDPQNHSAAQAPHTANTDTLLNRWLSSPGTAQNGDTKLPAINASNRHAEDDQTQHFIHGDRVDMHHTWEIKARGNPHIKLGYGALPQPEGKYDKLQKQ